MPDPRHDLGRAAEDAVAAWLSEAGWQIVSRRQRSAHGGEVDLVAIDPQRTLVAIEVRARRSARAGSAVESVDGRRVARAGRTLAAVAASLHVPHNGLRIDLVSVEPLVGTSGRWRLWRVPGIG